MRGFDGSSRMGIAKPALIHAYPLNPRASAFYSFFFVFILFGALSRLQFLVSPGSSSSRDDADRCGGRPPGGARG